MAAIAEAGKKPNNISVSLYRAVWRWHFFAGLLVIPFMINLAVTGGLYLFKDEIDDTIFAYRNVVEPKSESLAPSLLAENARAAVPGSKVVRYRVPSDPSHSVRVTVGTSAEKTLVFVNPYSGAVLGTVPEENEFNLVVRRIHGLKYFGIVFNKMVEAVGGLALILVVTGFYLWWPRKQTGGVVSVRGTPSKRVFWRDLHAVTGASAGALIFFLAISGMPWSGYWGGQVNAALSSSGMGYPTQLWDDVPVSAIPTKNVVDHAGWTVENAPVPTSTPNVSGKSVSLDQIVKSANDAGVAPGYEVSMPTGRQGVYTAAIFPDDITKQRTIHYDRYTGKPLIDINFSQYGIGGKVIEFGVGVHMGQYWGLANQIVMLLTCLAIVLTSVTAIIMWWKRRPSGRLGVPPMPSQTSVFITLTLVILGFGIAFPLTGFAILAMLVIDQLITRIPSPLKRVFS
ncbi:PepSY domain-containing protein [Phyllobacterium sp. YR531]|uniref:PepSY-associated TM helix domain-containing protein n=1 Tax=Phyllobacterium sp. YR531 TaxID=1144343 RepID=UPI00026FAA29|nr:PepSY domain-containing protein [Phyllobacterium sp. YR531]EJN00598.1 putative iron-regulated membrane protein [Phyllobacterium sp. YR531]